MKYIASVMAFIICSLTACSASNDELYNCYMVSYVNDFETFITVPITTATSKEQSIRLVEQEIKETIQNNNTNDKQNDIKTVQISNNAIERLGDNVIRFFCFPSILDNKNDVSISEFINSLNSEQVQIRRDSLFPLDEI